MTAPAPARPEIRPELRIDISATITSRASGFELTARTGGCTLHRPGEARGPSFELTWSEWHAIVDTAQRLENMLAETKQIAENAVSKR